MSKCTAYLKTVTFYIYNWWKATNFLYFFKGNLCVTVGRFYLKTVKSIMKMCELFVLDTN